MMMKKLTAIRLVLSLIFLAFFGVNPAQAVVTLDNAGVTSDTAVSVNGAAASAVNIGTTATTGTVTIGSSTSPLILKGFTWPASFGAAGAVLTTDGAGGLSWTTVSGLGDMLLSAVQTVSGAKTFNSGKLLLGGATSGAITLNAPAVAGTGTVTLPASGTLLSDATAVTIPQGGTGAATAGGARTNLGAAASGANSDITSLTGLTTALSVAQGGTSATTAASAFNNLAPTTTLGDLIIHNGTGNVRLPGNTTLGKQFLTQTGTGVISAAPAWGSISSADVSGLGTLATQNASNVNITGGTIANVTLSGATLSGVTVPISAGGTGATTEAGARTNLGLGTLATQNGTFSGTSSGTNSGDVTIGTANGLSLAGQALSLGLASTSTNGALSSADWNTFNNKLSGNSITGATKTKITYDANGLVTAGADATTADIAPSVNRRYVTDAELAVIGNTSGTNTGDQVISDATLTTSDITTNNVSTTKHGFVPKLPNDATKFLDGTGSFSVPVTSGGTVTSVSVVTANGVSGSVANATTTPAITLTLGAITPTSVAATGTVTGSNLSGTNTGDQDLSALLVKSSNLSDVANATTARTNLSAAKSGANSDITSLTGLTTALSIAQGGTGLTSLTANGVLIGNGTLAPTFVAPGASGNVLTSNGTSWVSQAPAGGGITSLNGLTGATQTFTNDTNVTVNSTGSAHALGWSGTLSVARGGTGVNTFGGTNTLLYTTAADTLSSIATANNGVLVTNGSGAPSIGTTLPNAVQDNITRVGTVTSGTWSGTAVAVNKGGTGATDAAAARTNLGVVDIYQGASATPKANAKIWTGTGTTSGGTVSISIPNGIFTTIYSAQATAVSNTSSASTVPVASIKSISTTQIDVNVVESRAVTVLGGEGMEFSGAVTVYVTVIGE